MNHYKELNFDVVAVSDIWKRRREEGAAIWKEKMQHDIVGCRNNEEIMIKNWWMQYLSALPIFSMHPMP